MYSVKESDWKLFRKLLPGWQERFMGRLLGEYAKIMAGKGLVSDRFWKLQKTAEFHLVRPEEQFEAKK